MSPRDWVCILMEGVSHLFICNLCIYVSMYMCMYICTYVCMCVCIRMYVHIYVIMHVHDVSMYICVLYHLYVRMHTKNTNCVPTYGPLQQH